MAKLEIRDLAKTFSDEKRGNTHVLGGVNISVEKGEFISIVGPSGCGKTTLLECIGGLQEPSTGEIRIDGNIVSGTSLDRAIVFQQYALFPWLTTRKNIEFGPKMRGIGKDQRFEASKRYIEMVGLSGFENHYPHELSGGMQQRVALARALANDPEILLLDEPFAALDAQTRENCQQELLKLWRETGLTTIFITHDIGESVFLADKVFVLTSRPAVVNEVLVNMLPRPRGPEVRIMAEFRELEYRIRELIAGGVKVS